MGYDFHITRRAHWADETGAAIDSAEWLNVAGSMAELRPIAISPLTKANLPSEWLSHCWHGHPATDGQHGPIFRFVDGRVTFRGDDPATLRLALALAERLSARLVGDEGEEITLAEILRPADDAFSHSINPFTGERLINEWKGTVVRDEEELHLQVKSGGFLGIGQKQTLFLLHFVVAATGNSEDLHGRTLRLRGTLSALGTYGTRRACANVLYVMRILDR